MLQIFSVLVGGAVVTVEIALMAGVLALVLAVLAGLGRDDPALGESLHPADQGHFVCFAHHDHRPDFPSLSAQSAHDADGGNLWKRACYLLLFGPDCECGHAMA